MDGFIVAFAVASCLRATNPQEQTRTGYPYRE